MALKTKFNKYEALKESRKTYKLPFLDSETENNAGSFCTSVSSGFISPHSSNSPSLLNFDVKQRDNSFDLKLESIFDSFNLDENTPSHLSSTKPNTSMKTGWEESINSLFDQNSKQFEIFENFVQSSCFTDCSMFSYSPLSSLESIPNDQSYIDLYYRMQQESIRKEFETNGNFVDDAPPPSEIFQPLAMSTPFVGRKSDQYKLNNSIAFKDKENVFSAQFPKFCELNDKPSAYDIEFPNLFPMRNLRPSFSSVPSYDNNKMNKNQGRKRSYPVTQHHEQFGSAKTNKLSKKNNNGKKKVDDFCVFCKNNGADELIYKSHAVRDSKGRVLCPKLRAYQCPICGADGDSSHTVKYCPKKPIITMEDLKKLEASNQKSKRF